MLHILFIKTKNFYPFSNKIGLLLFFMSGVFFYLAGFNKERTSIESFYLYIGVFLASIEAVEAIIYGLIRDYIEITDEQAFKLSLIAFPFTIVVIYFAVIQFDYL